VNIVADTWKMALKKRSFWTDYFWITEPYKGDYSWLSSPYKAGRTYPELANEIRFTISKSFQLGFDLDEKLSYSSLMLYHDTVPNGIELGWMDGHCFHPYVFRWSEIEKLGQLLSPQVPECPSAPFLLLTLFSIITMDEEVETVQKQLESAWRSLNLFSDQELEVIIATCCHPFDDKSWEYDEDYGWYLEGDDAYSLRHPNVQKIPVELFQEFLQQIE
jgi:hypothetical protein